jgi:hypothetical protein
MSGIVIDFPGRIRPGFSLLDAGRDGQFLLFTDDLRQQSTFGPFDSVEAARNYARRASEQQNGRIRLDWEQRQWSAGPADLDFG